MTLPRSSFSRSKALLRTKCVKKGGKSDLSIHVAKQSPQSGQTIDSSIPYSKMNKKAFVKKTANEIDKFLTKILEQWLIENEPEIAYS